MDFPLIKHKDKLIQSFNRKGAMVFGEFFAPHAVFSSCEPTDFLEELLVSERTLPALIYC